MRNDRLSNDRQLQMADNGEGQIIVNDKQMWLTNYGKERLWQYQINNDGRKWEMINQGNGRQWKIT